MACSTCHVVLEDGVFEQLELACEDEEDMLDMAFGLTDTYVPVAILLFVTVAMLTWWTIILIFLLHRSRLGCQVLVDESFEGTTVTLPKATRNFYVDGHVPKPH